MFEIGLGKASLFEEYITAFAPPEPPENAAIDFIMLKGSPIIKKNPCIKRYGPARASCSAKGNPNLLNHITLITDSTTTNKLLIAKITSFFSSYFTPFIFNEVQLFFSLFDVSDFLNLYPRKGSSTQGATKYIYTSATYNPGTELKTSKLITGMAAESSVILLFLLQNFFNILIVVPNKLIGTLYHILAVSSNLKIRTKEVRHAY